MTIEATGAQGAPPETPAIRIGVIMNGVTGRMGTNQHLVRSILAIRREGGIRLPDGARVVPEPLLVGRDEQRLRALAERHGVDLWTTDLDSALADPDYAVYFDAQATAVRAASLERAIAAGKHVYCEKPSAPDSATALRVARLAEEAGVKHGVVQDKLFLPGLRKLRALVEEGFFGRVLSVRGEFGYWVFEGPEPEPQRPSWNYRAQDGGGIVSDMFAHWRYVLDHVIAPVRSVYSYAAMHIPTRVDEQGVQYPCTADDAAYAIFELQGGAIAQLNSSWAVRVHRDELLELQVDGTDGSAVAGLHDCLVQTRAETPRATWNPDLPEQHRYREGWRPHRAQETFDNAFKHQWELFLRHVACDEPYGWDLFEGAKGIQLAELAEASSRERRMVTVPELAR